MAQGLRGNDIYGNEGNYPKSMQSLTIEERKDLGKLFIDETRMHRKDAPRFTDKMPNNFRHIGLIHLILPNAKIIDARRYPLDCCFSMFKQLFAQGQEFTYGLAEAGSYYNSYVKLMDHWDKVLPNKILRINNEDASSEQVRKPVNKSGQGRWKPYAKNLGALLENIDNNLLKPEDIALIKS